jgi:hypothetical protein
MVSEDFLSTLHQFVNIWKSVRGEWRMETLKFRCCHLDSFELRLYLVPPVGEHLHEHNLRDG